MKHTASVYFCYSKLWHDMSPTYQSYFFEKWRHHTIGRHVSDVFVYFQRCSVSYIKGLYHVL